MKKVVTIIGGNSEVSDYALKQSFELGKKIIDNGWVLCTGGRGGVMDTQHDRRCAYT